ncbi:MAG: hypothetical protein CNLJKLNK_00339 [Holosporales bacterium]
MINKKDQFKMIFIYQQLKDQPFHESYAKYLQYFPVFKQ